MKLDNRKGTLGATDCTVRNIVHLSLGGKSMRVVVSNEMGTTPLTVGAAEVALSSGDAGIAKGTSKVITFEGSPSVTIPAGVKIFSDSVPIDLPFQANVAISLFLPAQPIPFVTAHSYGNQANFIAPGNGVGAPALANAVETDMWQFVSAVEVQAPPEGAAIVTLGDSITDGAFSTRSANLRWPDDLARRLHANQKTRSLAVLNEGIGGNRILHGEHGQFVVDSALARFDRDVLSQAGVRYLVLLEGINDIGIATKPENPGAAVTASDLILGITQLIERAHAHGIRVYVGTIMPDKGLGFYYSDAGEKLPAGGRRVDSHQQALRRCHRLRQGAARSAGSPTPAACI